MRWWRRRVVTDALRVDVVLQAERVVETWCSGDKPVFSEVAAQIRVLDGMLGVLRDHQALYRR